MKQKTSPQNLIIAQLYHPEDHWRGYNALIVDNHKNFFAAGVKGWPVTEAGEAFDVGKLNGRKLKKLTLSEACRLAITCQRKEESSRQSWNGDSRELLIACNRALTRLAPKSGTLELTLSKRDQKRLARIAKEQPKIGKTAAEVATRIVMEGLRSYLESAAA